MHVAFVVGNYPPRVGGVERHVQAVATRLLAAGERVTVFSVEPRGTRRADGVPILGLGRRFEISGVIAFPAAGTTRAVAAHMARTDVTHVSVHTRFFPATWVGLAASRAAGIPSVLTEHGGGHVRTGRPAIRWGARLVDETIGRRSMSAADEVLAVSQRAAAFVRQLSGRTAAVCGNGIDLAEWTAPAPPEPRRHLVFAGRLVPEKGWREFLAVTAAMDADVTGIVLGGGPEEGKVVAEIGQRGLQGRVRFGGQVSPPELRQLYAGSVYVNPSTAAEGLQTTLLEAAAAGARIATYDVGGAQEVFAAGAVGGVVPPGDLGRLIDATRRALDTRWREPHGLAAYDWSGVTAAYRVTFERLAGRA